MDGSIIGQRSGNNTVDWSPLFTSRLATNALPIGTTGLQLLVTCAILSCAPER
jgi:hypothetical protein